MKGDESAILARVVTGEKNRLADQVLWIKAVEMLEEEEVQEGMEQFLRPYHIFMERNPRSMKRLLSRYSINRVIVVLADPSLLETERHRAQLVLWTVLTLRWPLLADYLRDHVEHVEFIRKGIRLPDSAGEELCDLALDDNVQAVVAGRDLGMEGEILEIESLKVLVRVLQPRG